MRRLLLTTALFTVPFVGTADAATTWVVKGGGWGHGLGMSQYGAYGQARAGRDYKTILKHYYRGTKLSTAKGSVRVLLLASAGSSSFTGANRVGNKSVKPGATYVASGRGGRVIVRTRRGKVVARSSGELRVMGPNGLVTVGGKGTYRDVIVLRPGLSGGVTVINKVELENYIRGVVPNESPASWPQAALRAQAVAARSYALGTGGGPIYDHSDTAGSQVYGGYSSEQPSSNRAVAATKAEVLRYDGKVIVAYFHSTSGGHTENNENIFSCTGCSAIPYIRGVRDPWDKYSPYHHWRLTYNAQRLGNALGVGRLKSVRINKKGVSGRIVYATFRGSGGRVRLHGWEQIKARLGLRDAPSVVKRISSRGSAARVAAAGVGEHGFVRDITGTIEPAKAGQKLVVQIRAKNGWRRVASGRVRKGGRYRIALGRPGTYRVLSQGDPGPAVRVR
jgi:stage II sporulation protein D